MAGELTAESPKALLRREVLAAREAQSVTARAAAGTCITRELMALDAWQQARCVLLYLSFGSEFDTAALVADALARDKQLCLPRVDKAAHALSIRRVADPVNDVEAGVWGIREPRLECPVIDLEAIDFVLVPGVAFTPRCERLGYGGGYYDGLIARFAQRPPLVAAAFDLQMRAQIPLGEHDRTLDLVVTETAAHCGC